MFDSHETPSVCNWDPGSPSSVRLSFSGEAMPRSGGRSMDTRWTLNGHYNGHYENAGACAISLKKANSPYTFLCWPWHSLKNIHVLIVSIVVSVVVSIECPLSVHRASTVHRQGFLEIDSRTRGGDCLFQAKRKLYIHVDGQSLFCSRADCKERNFFGRLIEKTLHHFLPGHNLNTCNRPFPPHLILRSTGSSPGMMKKSIKSGHHQNPNIKPGVTGDQSKRKFRKLERILGT